jgi:hypothetical protein
MTFSVPVSTTIVRVARGCSAGATFVADAMVHSISLAAANGIAWSKAWAMSSFWPATASGTFVVIH